MMELMNAVRYGTRTHISYILDTNKNLIDQYDEQGSTCFHWAAKRGDYDILDLLKSYYGSVLDVAANCENQMRPVHWAASDGKIQSMRFFMDNRMDINCLDANGCSPLAVAVQYMQTDTALYLMKNGADLSLKDNNGDTPLHWAAYKGSEELVGLLMYFMPRELDTEDKFGQTATHLAALSGHYGVLEFLIKENGADYGKKDKNGLTPLDLAMKKEHPQCEYVLRKHKTSSCFELGTSTGKRLWTVRGLMPNFICGSNERERGQWMWRATFYPNLVASMVSIYYATLPQLADLAILQLFSTVFQVLWWVCFLLILYWPPSYVIDVEPDRGAHNGYISSSNNNSSTHSSRNNSSGSSDKEGGATANPFLSYGRALDRIVEVLGNESPLAHMTHSMPTVCHSCHVVRPLRSKHCKVMRRCIHKFDHYCPFVHNAVSRDNYKYFMGVIFFFPFCYVSFMWMTYVYWRRGGELSWMFTMFLIYSTFLCMMVCALLQYHYTLITRNLTTNEEINVQRYTYLHNEFSRFSNPFDKGSPFNNLLDGLWPSAKSYFNRDQVLEDKKAEEYASSRAAGKQLVTSVEDEESFFEEAKTKLISK